MSLRAVFDTNILISASISLTGTPFHCLALARAGEVESVTCQEILNEFREKGHRHRQRCRFPACDQHIKVGVSALPD